jgi:hypothetical protein
MDYQIPDGGFEFLRISCPRVDEDTKDDIGAFFYIDFVKDSKSGPAKLVKRIGTDNGPALADYLERVARAIRETVSDIAKNQEEANDQRPTNH